MTRKSGKVYLIGAGPGDPELLTVKAVKALQKADLILYDRLVSAEVLAVANPAAEFRNAGKGFGEQDAVQCWILEELFAAARSGKTVARLKGGDPFVFGRGGEEWLALRQNGIEVEVIPGVSSALAVPGLAGVPVTFRGISRGFTVLTGHCSNLDETEWSRYAACETLVILMGVKRRAAIARSLIAAGRPDRQAVAFIERGTTPSERVVVTTLAEVASGLIDVAAPAVFVVGDVVEMRRALVGAVEDEVFVTAPAA